MNVSQDNAIRTLNNSILIGTVCTRDFKQYVLLLQVIEEIVIVKLTSTIRREKFGASACFNFDVS